MGSYPVRVGKRAVSKVDEGSVEVIRPAARTGPFVSFQYSYTEISAVGGRANVKSRKARLEDGKLTTETFEGDLDRSAYEQRVSEAQRYFLGQAELFLKSLESLLPFWR
jgi:hypothetical protein